MSDVEAIHQVIRTYFEAMFQSSGEKAHATEYLQGLDLLAIQEFCSSGQSVEVLTP